MMDTNTFVKKYPRLENNTHHWLLNFIKKQLRFDLHSELGKTFI